MNPTNRSIFRKEALEKFLGEQQAPVFPKFVSPRLFLYLWSVFGVLCGLGVWLCFVEVPLFVSGQGVIVEQDEVPSCPGQGPCVAAFFPPHHRSHLVAGKSLMIRHKNRRQWLDEPLVIMESNVLSPAEVRDSGILKTGALSLPTHSVAVALCRMHPDTHPIPSDGPIDGTFEVRIEAGTRPLASFLPVLDRFFKRPSQPERKGT